MGGLGLVTTFVIHGMRLVSSGRNGTILSDRGYTSFVPPFHLCLPRERGLERLLGDIQVPTDAHSLWRGRLEALSIKSEGMNPASG